MKPKFKIGDRVKITHSSCSGRLGVVQLRSNKHSRWSSHGDVYRIQFDTGESPLVYEVNFVLVVPRYYEDFQDKIKDRLK